MLIIDDIGEATVTVATDTRAVVLVYTIRLYDGPAVGNPEKRETFHVVVPPFVNSDITENDFFDVADDYARAVCNPMVTAWTAGAHTITRGYTRVAYDATVDVTTP